MTLTTRFSALSLLALLSASFAQAGDLQEIYNRLRDSGADYNPAGAVCEQVARLDLMETYPSPQYTVVTGVGYSDGTRVVGELDEVVFRNSDGKAVLVGEVKCRNNLSSAKRKAADQRERFINAMRSGDHYDLYLAADPSVKYELRQFRDVSEFVSIAQKGSIQAGFDMDIDYSLDEMKELRLKLLNCQHSGQCRAPLR